MRFLFAFRPFIRLTANSMSCDIPILSSKSSGVSRFFSENLSRTLDLQSRRTLKASSVGGSSNLPIVIRPENRSALPEDQERDGKNGRKRRKGKERNSRETDNSQRCVLRCQGIPPVNILICSLLRSCSPFVVGNQKSIRGREEKTNICNQTTMQQRDK